MKARAGLAVAGVVSVTLAWWLWRDVRPAAQRGAGGEEERLGAARPEGPGGAPAGRRTAVQPEGVAGFVELPEDRGVPTDARELAELVAWSTRARRAASARSRGCGTRP